MTIVRFRPQRPSYLYMDVSTYLDSLLGWCWVMQQFVRYVFKLCFSLDATFTLRFGALLAPSARVGAQGRKELGSRVRALLGPITLAIRIVGLPGRPPDLEGRYCEYCARDLRTKHTTDQGGGCRWTTITDSSSKNTLMNTSSAENMKSQRRTYSYTY